MKTLLSILIILFLTTTLVFGVAYFKVLAISKESTVTHVSPLSELGSVVYDFYGHCDIIYLEITNTEYIVTTEGRDHVSTVKSIDVALKEVTRLLLDCDDW